MEFDEYLLNFIEHIRAKNSWECIAPEGVAIAELELCAREHIAQIIPYGAITIFVEDNR